MGENIHSKNTYYRFLENDSFNWPRLLFLLSAKVTSYFQSLCNPSRCGLFVIDDSTIHRDRNKKADLLARTYDHVTGKYCKGFTLLTRGWTDSFSFIPVLLNLLSSTQNETITTKHIQLDGKLAAGNNLTITTDHDITNDSAKENYGITQADGNLTISAKGNLTNSKKLESKGTLTLSAKDISNKESGEINGGSVSITSTTLTNRGLVSADQANTITTDILQNIATGRIYGEDITLHAKTLENRKDKVLEEKLAAAMKDLKQKEKDLDDAFAIDVTAFKSNSEKENYFKEIENKQAAYAASKEAVDAILADMAQVKSATIAARNDMIITGDTLLNSASSLLYAGGDMAISEAKDITNQGADIKAQGNMSLTAPTITNANEAFSAKRVWTSEVTNPDLIRIDENGHPEKGQSFTRNEFSALDSGYGAYHNKGITPKTLYEEAGYDKIEQITEEERKDGETPVPRRFTRQRSTKL